MKLHPSQIQFPHENPQQLEPLRKICQTITKVRLKCGKTLRLTSHILYTPNNLSRIIFRLYRGLTYSYKVSVFTQHKNGIKSLKLELFFNENRANSLVYLAALQTKQL